MPAKCCIAPEIPAAIYKFGATTFPVCPTCQSLGTYPASTAARLAPIAAPSLSASFSRTWKFSLEPSPLPPDTTMSAAVNSGRSFLESSEFMYLVKVVFSPDLMEVIFVSLSLIIAFSKAVVLIVNIFKLSLLLQVAIALPAYIGLLNVSMSMISMTSGIIITSNNAAKRGAVFLPFAVLENNICVYFSAIECIKIEVSSAKGFL